MSTILARTGPGGIPSRCGNLPGRGDATAMKFVEDVLTPSAPLEVYNLNTSPVRSESFVFLATIQGRWVVTHEVC